MSTCPLCGHDNPDDLAVCPACGHGEGIADAQTQDSFLARLPWHTRRFLFVFYGLAALDGITAFSGSGDLAFVFSVACGLTAAWWVITDASDRGRPMTCAARLLVILFGGISAFFYLIATRRLRGLGWFLLHSIAYIATAAGPTIVANLVLAESTPQQQDSFDASPVTPKLPPLPSE
ncbi:MAG: zinc ribbon domain-containing protein [Planctomycetaceae bacterium]